MSDNQPFNPPLSAEERALWDHMITNGFDYLFADARLAERRRRFGVPVQPNCMPGGIIHPSVMQFGNPEIDKLRAEVERLTKERDELRESLNKAVDTGGNLLAARHEARARAEKAEAGQQRALKLLEVEHEKAIDLRQEIDKLRAELAAVKAPDGGKLTEEEIKEWERDLDLLGDNRSQMLDREGLQCVIALMREGLAAKRELAAAKPVLEAVVRWSAPGGCYGDWMTLRAYGDAQRAKRAGGAT